MYHNQREKERKGIHHYSALQQINVQACACLISSYMEDLIYKILYTAALETLRILTE